MFSYIEHKDKNKQNIHIILEGYKILHRITLYFNSKESNIEF